MGNEFITFAVVFGIATAAVAQPVVTPPPEMLPATKIVDGWTIAPTALGCDVRYLPDPVGTPRFWMQQSGRQGWEFVPNADIRAIQDAHVLQTASRPMTRDYLIDGNRVGAAVVEKIGVVTMLAGAKRVNLIAEGYVDKRSREQLAAAYAASRQTTMDDFVWQTARQDIRVPGQAAKAALQQCAASPRERNRPAAAVRRSGRVGALGLSEDWLIANICQRGGGPQKIAAMAFTLSVDAEGIVTAMTPVAGTMDMRAAEKMAGLLRRHLRMRPATDGAGRFVASSVSYRSPAVDLDCGAI